MAIDLSLNRLCTTNEFSLTSQYYSITSSGVSFGNLIFEFTTYESG